MQSGSMSYRKISLVLVAVLALGPAAAVAQDACAALDAPMVRYDPAGKPFVFTIEYPQGWFPHELIVGSTATVDFMTPRRTVTCPFLGGSITSAAPPSAGT